MDGVRLVFLSWNYFACMIELLVLVTVNVLLDLYVNGEIDLLWVYNLF